MICRDAPYTRVALCRLASTVALAWLFAAAACVDDTTYCQSADDCPEGRCVLGRCDVPAMTDGAPPDAAATDWTPPRDADAVDQARMLDAAPACDDGDRTFERCGPGQIRRLDCVGGSYQPSACAPVPEDPCGELCRGEGCDSAMRPGIRRRQAFGDPSMVPGLSLFLPQTTSTLRCSGCRHWAADGSLDFTCETALDLDRLPTRTDCRYCDRDEEETTLYERDGQTIDFETRCLPSNRRVSLGRIILRPDDQVDRVELDRDGRLITHHGRYGPGDLLEAIETTELVDGESVVRARRLAQRGEDGRLDGMAGRGRYGDFTIDYDYGCRPCAEPDCPASPLEGCAAVPATQPPVYLCPLEGPYGSPDGGCPEGTRPAWFEGLSELVWATTYHLDPGAPGPPPRPVGARREDGAWIWQATGEPITVPLLGGIEAERGNLGGCARVQVIAGNRDALGASGYTEAWSAALEVRRCAELDAALGWCRAEPAHSKDLPAAD